MSVKSPSSAVAVTAVRGPADITIIHHPTIQAHVRRIGRPSSPVTAKLNGKLKLAMPTNDFPIGTTKNNLKSDLKHKRRHRSCSCDPDPSKDTTQSSKNKHSVNIDVWPKNHQHVAHVAQSCQVVGRRARRTGYPTSGPPSAAYTMPVDSPGRNDHLGLDLLPLDSILMHPNVRKMKMAALHKGCHLVHITARPPVPANRPAR